MNGWLIVYAIALVVVLVQLYVQGMGSGALTAFAAVGMDDDQALDVVERVMARVRADAGQMGAVRAEVMSIVAAHTIDIERAVSAAEALANGSSS